MTTREADLEQPEITAKVDSEDTGPTAVALEDKKAEKPLGVMRGGETIRVRVGKEVRFYQIYEFPKGSGEYVSYQFKSQKQARKALGKGFDRRSRTESWFDQHIVAEASAEETIGSDRGFYGMIRDVMQDAASEAGIDDPTLAGKIASNKEMQRIMAKATVGDWTLRQVKAAQRQTDFWKNELYPGIENFYGQASNPEAAWADYANNVEDSLRALGYNADADGTFNRQIRKLLDGGVSDDTFVSMTPVFIKAEQNGRFANVLNQWAERDLGRSVDFNNWFDLLSGESEPELAQVAERAQLAYQASEASAEVSNRQIRRLSNRTNLTEGQAAQVFANLNQSVLALGDAGLSRYGLSRDDILSAAAGIEPRGGRSIEEVKLTVAKAAREIDLFDEDKIDFYVGFDPMGRPNRPGLRTLAPTGA